ncbi:MAG: hypothetical protein ACIALR_00145 [Blastopirellula sp. JB062]
MKRSSAKPPVDSSLLLPSSNPPVKRPVALRWALAALAAWLMFLVAMASD